MERSWILVGMMGAGKSSVGRELAALAARRFVDTDRLVQNRFGRPVSKIFEIYGEEAFREHETSVLRELEPGADVVATGGGIIQREQNWVEIRRLGTSIFLKVPIERIEERLMVSRKRRPLLETDDWQSKLRSIYAARLPMYERADLTIEIDQDHAGRIAERILEMIEVRS